MNNSIDALLEAVLFAAGDPVEPEKLASVLAYDRNDIEDAFHRLADRLNSSDDCGLQIICINGKYQMTTKSLYAKQIRDVLAVKNNSPLSSAAFEVLAIVAYNQPVTKPFIEQIRGVDCTAVMSTLCQRNLIEEHGRLDLPGRPLLYCTTENFLRCFGMSSLDELPKLPETDGNNDPSENSDDNNEVEGQISMI